MKTIYVFCVRIASLETFPSRTPHALFKLMHSYEILCSFHLRFPELRLRIGVDNARVWATRSAHVGHTRVAGRPCAGERARVARQRDALAVRTYERHIRDAHGARTPCARRETRAHVAGTEQSGERARWLQWLGVGTERSRAIAHSDRPFSGQEWQWLAVAT